MARKSRRTRRFNLRLVRTSTAVALTTLANVTVLTAVVTGAADGAYRAMTLTNTWSLKGLTASEGPITVGYAHSDYTVTEIKEAIEAGASISIGNKVAQEQANRLVRIVGSFSGLSTNEVLEHGEPISTKLNWFIPIGESVSIFAYNDSGATLTTGAIVDVTGKMFVKDSQ